MNIVGTNGDASSRLARIARRLAIAAGAAIALYVLAMVAMGVFLAIAFAVSDAKF